ncbi:hypothetical protein [Nocardia sp. NPDC052566]|uniref:hypothetical protein n=1 Tax=Nocardia sp. NPDC052566 TaxID=3364330 RepID=UPI0037C57E61
MADTVTVDPVKLRSAANKSAAIHDQMKTTLANLETKLNSAGSPWGADGFGDKFAKGEKGYIAARDSLFLGSQSMAKTFGELATGQRDAAHNLDGQEALNTRDAQLRT